MDSSRVPSGCCEVSILITDDLEIKELNRTYRGKNKATDVLSFPQISDKASQSELLGDIILSHERAKDQARELGVTYENEVLRLLIHGVLHLFGYDHEGVSIKEAREMRTLEDQIFFNIKSGKDKSTKLVI